VKTTKELLLQVSGLSQLIQVAIWVENASMQVTYRGERVELNAEVSCGIYRHESNVVLSIGVDLPLVDLIDRRVAEASRFTSMHELMTPNVDRNLALLRSISVVAPEERSYPIRLVPTPVSFRVIPSCPGT